MEPSEWVEDMMGKEARAIFDQLMANAEATRLHIIFEVLRKNIEQTTNGIKP